ncbi:MAG: hypothetical protein GF310_01325 [candidate division Zixibacteria bacterium]|nr:hypothetical protein [candidate division Zixibacteria bacterium]
MLKFSIYSFIILCLVPVLALTANVKAAEVEATLSSDVISIDGQVTLSIIITGGKDADEPTLPPIGGFNVYTAGKTFSSSSVNGVTSTSVKYKYVLVPQRTGKFLIGPIKVKVDGKEFSTEPMAITVEKGTRRDVPSRAERPDNATENGEYIIDAEISKDTVFEGELLVHEFKAFQRRGAGFMSDPVYVPPSYSGFWREEFGWKRYTRRLQGNVYVVNQMDSYLFPVSPGEVQIEPTRVVVTPDAFSNFFSFDPFDSRGRRSRQHRMQPETLFTEPLIINVLPLPRESRPRDFKGAVGSFDMDVDISRTDVTVDETILLTIKIAGQGNIKTISSPDIPEIEGLDIRPSGDTTSVREAGGVIAGLKIFEYSIIPEQEGIYEIPSLKWSYFDPETENYRTLASEEYEINIEPGASAGDDAFAGRMNIPGDIKVRDILGVKTLDGRLKKKSKPLIMSPVFIGVQAVPLILLAGVILFRKRQEKLMGDLRLRRLKRAHGLARKKLSSASSLLKSGNPDDFYGEVSRAVYQYVGDKFNYSASGLTESKVVEILQDEGYSEETIEEFRELIQTSDFGRFAPGQSGEDSAGELLKQAEKWIVTAEHEGKRVK